MELNPSYYNILGVSIDSSDDQIRRAYRKLAMQWHPDKWTKNPSLSEKAKRKFQLIQEAYSVLSDEKKRSMYDVGMYDPRDEVDEGFADFVQEMTSLMENVKKEEKKYSFGEIQDMFWEMAQSFNLSDDSSFNYNVEYQEPYWSREMFTSDDETRSSKRARATTNPLTQFHESGISRQQTKCVWIDHVKPDENHSDARPFTRKHLFLNPKHVVVVCL